MSDYQKSLDEERQYLERTLKFLKEEIKNNTELLSGRKKYLRTAGKEMWEDSVHFTNDFEKLTEVNQHLTEVGSQAIGYGNTWVQLDKYKRAVDAPYFGRFDFEEEGSCEREKIYIGLSNIMNHKNHGIYVYDWRAPIAGVFYRFELGKASYKAPFGDISGEVFLKRQYKIQRSELGYFLDCCIKIDDEILQEVLGKSASPRMKNIVETIQREQDTIIRDMENELLIVQGVAGSGKTSVALHRIAFLLYHGMNSNISTQNIIIISPNSVFSKYISNVLPELGEENVKELSFENYAVEALKEKGKAETRGEWLEGLIASESAGNLPYIKASAEFKGSSTFVQILDRFIEYFEKHMILFEDVYYVGKIIENRQLLKAKFLDNKINVPAAKRLKRIENMVLDKIQPVKRARLKKIEDLVQRIGEHEFEIKAFSRLLSIKESKTLLGHMRKFTSIDYYKVYTTLFTKKGLLSKIAYGLELPSSVENIAEATGKRLESGIISYEDCAPLLYVKLKLEGCESYSNIRQVVIDEAQDYSPIQYEVFNMMFKDARYTVLGDVSQSIEKEVDVSFYDTVIKAFNKRKSVRISLNKSYRSSFEISEFSQRLLDRKQNMPFERHEEEPQLVEGSSVEDMEFKIMQDAASCLKDGYESVAVICKTVPECEKLYEKFKNVCNIKYINSKDDEIEKGIVIIPSYIAKGLEFDVVLVFDVSSANYCTELDKKLLYISCTRALHRLQIYYCGEKSPIIKC